MREMPFDVDYLSPYLAALEDVLAKSGSSFSPAELRALAAAHDAICRREDQLRLAGYVESVRAAAGGPRPGGQGVDRATARRAERLAALLRTLGLLGRAGVSPFDAPVVRSARVGAGPGAASACVGTGATGSTGAAGGFRAAVNRAVALAERVLAHRRSQRAKERERGAAVAVGSMSPRFDDVESISAGLFDALAELADDLRAAGLDAGLRRWAEPGDTDSPRRWKVRLVLGVIEQLEIF